MHYYKQKAYKKKTKYIKIAEYFLFPFFAERKKHLLGVLYDSLCISFVGNEFII